MGDIGDISSKNQSMAIDLYSGVLPKITETPKMVIPPEWVTPVKSPM